MLGCDNAVYVLHPLNPMCYTHCYGVICRVCVGGLGFEFCVFVAGWRHALRSEWTFIIVIICRVILV